jgi:hypothetical protein
VSLVRSVGGFGLIILGALIVAVGFVIDLNPNVEVGKAGSKILAAKLQEVGLLVILVGFTALIIVHVLRWIKAL